MHRKTHKHTHSCTVEVMNKRAGDRPESTGGGGEERDDERGGELGGRGQREIGGERIRL